MQKRTLISYSKNSCVNVNVCVVCWQVIQELGGGLRGDREVGGGGDKVVRIRSHSHLWFELGFCSPVLTRTL